MIWYEVIAISAVVWIGASFVLAYGLGRIIGAGREPGYVTPAPSTGSRVETT